MMFILTVHLYKYCHGCCMQPATTITTNSFLHAPSMSCVVSGHFSTRAIQSILNSSILFFSRWLYKNSCVLISNGKYFSVELWQMQSNSVWWFKRRFSLCLITGRKIERLWSTVLPGLSWNIPHFWKASTVVHNPIYKYRNIFLESTRCFKTKLWTDFENDK